MREVVLSLNLHYYLFVCSGLAITTSNMNAHAFILRCQGKNTLGQLLARLRDSDLQVCSQREAAVAIAAASFSAPGAGASVGAWAGGTGTGTGAAPARDRATAAGGESLSLKSHFSADLFDAAANPIRARAFCQALRNSTGPGQGGTTELPFEHATVGKFILFLLLLSSMNLNDLLWI